MTVPASDRRARISIAAARQTALLALFWLPLATIQGRTQVSAPSALPTLTTAEQIRELSPDQAVRRYPVRIRALVTYCDPPNTDYFVQDQSAGIFVHDTQGKFQFRPGQLLEIEGETEEPDFAPQIGNPRYRVLGEADLPRAKRVSLDDLNSAREDSQWVELDGIVHDASQGLTAGRQVPIPGGITLDLFGGGGHVPIRILDGGSLTPSRLTDARVRIRGVAATIFNQKNQLIGVQLDVPSSREVIVEEAAPADPFAIPLRPLNSLLVFTAQNTAEHRIRVQGTVTLVRPKGIFIQDGNQGLYLPGAAGGTLKPGDRVYVVGFSDIGAYTPVLRDAIFRKIGVAPAPPAINVSAPQALTGAYDTLRVQIEAILRDARPSDTDRMLVLQAGNTLFEARIAEASTPRNWQPPPVGSRLRLTGACSVNVDRNRAPDGFTILLPSPAGIVVLARPSWWTLRNTLVMTTVLSGVLLAGIAWVIVLRRRVRAQTQVIRERLENEAALEKRFQYVARATNDILWEWDLLSDRVWRSNALETVFGYSLTRTGQGPTWWYARIHPEDRARVAESVQTALDSATEKWSAEYRLKRSDGTYAYVLDRGYLMRDAAGKAVRMVGALMDLTVIRKAEQELREGEEKYRSLVLNIPDGLWTADAEGRFSYVSPQFERMSGYTAEEIKEQGVRLFFESVHPDDVRRVKQAYQSLLEGRADYDVEYRARTKDGKWIWVHDRAVVCYDKDGRRYTDGIISDITERKWQESELAYERMLFEALMDSVPDTIYFQDTASRFIRINKSQARLLGIADPNEAIGRTDFDFFPPEFAQACYEAEQRLLESGEPVIDAEQRLIRPDGQVQWLSTTESPIRDAEGKVIGYVGISRDITDRKRTESELQKAKETAEEASRVKSEFLANMSHEIRTPMNGILGMTQLALDTALTGEQRRYLEAVKTSANALLAVINEVLDFSKIEAGKLELNPTEFDLRSVLDENVEPFTLEARHKGLAFDCNIDDKIPELVIGDPTRICQVVTNLLGNAFKFTSRGEVSLDVTVEARDENGDLLHFVVTDTGIGIAADKQDLIFGAFAQADGSTTRRFGGTGLGLTISARLVQLMGGRIWVESAEGKGSRFHFTARMIPGKAQRPAFPADSRETLPQADSESSPTSGEQRGTILLAEDNPVNQLFISRLLERQGYRITVAGSGHDVLAALDREPFDLVLMDIQMPEMDGFEATRAIRARENGRGAHLPIIALTAHAMKGDRERCLEAGMDDYLSKPIRPRELFMAVEAQLFSRRTEGAESAAELPAGVSRP